MGAVDTVATNPHSYPWLVADIGGTNARFGIVRDGNTGVSDIKSFRCAEYTGPDAAARAYLAQLDPSHVLHPRVAAFAIATAIEGDAIKLTNNPWSFSRRAVECELGVQTLHLFNDFEALALSLPTLRPSDYFMLGSGRPNPALPMAVLGPGTGLGVAACMPLGSRWVAVSGEGGHVTASPADDFESDVLRVIRQQFSHVSAERLLSGIGLPVLHAAICALRGESAEPLASEEITSRGAAGTDPHCAATMETFCAMLGTVASNVALTVGARGGVFIGGGIAPRFRDFFARSRFRERFEAKGRFTDYMKRIPTAIITAANPALQGAAQGIANVVGASMVHA